jgi:DNA gyrase subunit A
MPTAIPDDPLITTQEIFTKYIYGPDFPTGAYIYGKEGIIKAYTTGKGSISIRASSKIIKKNGYEKIIINEIPYQVNKSILIKKIAELSKNKKIIGISEVRDESDKDGD